MPLRSRWNGSLVVKCCTTLLFLNFALIQSGAYEGHVTHLVVEEDSDYGRHHAQHVGESDRVAQHQQRDADDHDPLGGVGHGVAERADQVEDAEGDDVLGEVAEAADEQQDEGAGRARDVRL